jgi:uncharacterized protein (DUF2062 family)
MRKKRFIMRKKTKANRIARLLKTVYLKLFRINDSPLKIALGFGLGVFVGVMPGIGPVIALLLALIHGSALLDFCWPLKSARRRQDQIIMMFMMAGAHS